MIAALEALPPAGAGLWPPLEAACPAETAMIQAQGPLLGQPGTGLWVQTDGTGSAVALALRNTAGGAAVSALPEAGWPELLAFLQAAGWDSLTLPEAARNFARRLPRAVLCPAAVLEHPGGPLPALPEGLRAEPLGPAALLEHTLACFGPESIPAAGREEWLWAFALRCRRGTARAVGLWRQKELLAAGALAYQGPRLAVIGFVGVAPRHRGRGLGLCLTGALAQAARGASLRPLVCCRPGLQEFYRRAGFVPLGGQTEVRRGSAAGR